MADEQIEWAVVQKFQKNIGAFGFIGDKVAIIAAFYDSKDANKDGKVSLSERIVSFISPIKFEKAALVEVVEQGRVDTDALIRDPNFATERAALLVNFANGMIVDGIYASYLKMPVGRAAGEIAGRIVTGAVAQFFIRKGMEATVKKIYDEAVRNQLTNQRQ
jgi:hypothetical protein